MRIGFFNRELVWLDIRLDQPKVPWSVGVEKLGKKPGAMVTHDTKVC